MLTSKETSLRTYLMVLSGGYALVVLLCLYCLLFEPGPEGANQPLLITFSVLSLAKLLLCWYAIADVRGSTLLIKLIAWISIISTLAIACVLLLGQESSPVVKMLIGVSWQVLLYVWFTVSLLVAVTLSALLSAAEKQRFGLRYFFPHQFKTIMALAEVVIYGEEEIISSEDVARNVDRYFKSFQARSKWTMALVISVLYFYPILSLKPPLPFIAPEDRLAFLRKRFYGDVEARLIPEFWRVFAQGLIRIAKQLCYIGYYNDKRTFPSVGFVPFSERTGKPGAIPANQTLPLYVKSERDVNERIEGDVIIVGSGAAASILAKGLVESGRKVVMIERGNHERPETFTEDEMEMVSRLFQDGAIQAARDFRFTVFQGSCVGGSTVLNNAVCFKMPESVLDKWNAPGGLNVGLDRRGVMKSMDRVWDMIGVEHMDEEKVSLNPGGYLFRKGCKELGYDIAPNVVDSVNANISGCLGCGYCNIGCKYDRKLSMLVTILPAIQGRHGKESLQIVAGCEATKLRRKGSRIEFLECEFTSGKKARVFGKTFVVAAGAVSSSILLLKSKLGIDNAGKNLSFNIGSQMTAAFPNKIDSYAGLQISHYLKISPDTGYVMESWFNPPMFQSTAMPGWFEDHYRNMRRYDRLACVGLLVGSESNARVHVAGLTHREIEYTPTNKDFQTLLAGLELSGEIMIASGATSVMPNTFKYYEFTNRDEVKRLHELVQDPSEITLGTGHPQGGNIISNSRSTGVVNPEFKVFGYENLYVCDASVFPTSLGVNPQLTVMGLADYAVQFMTDNKG